MRTQDFSRVRRAHRSVKDAIASLNSIYWAFRIKDEDERIKEIISDLEKVGGKLSALADTENA